MKATLIELNSIRSRELHKVEATLQELYQVKKELQEIHSIQ